MPDVGERPRLDVAVVAGDAQTAAQADRAQVLEGGVAAEPVEHPGRRVMSETAAVAADRPLDPEQRHAHEGEARQIRDEEGAAAVLGGLGGEPEEVTEADRVACGGENETGA